MRTHSHRAGPGRQPGDPSSPWVSVLGACVGHTEQSSSPPASFLSAALTALHLPHPRLGAHRLPWRGHRGHARVGPGGAVRAARDAELAWGQVFRKLSEGARRLRASDLRARWGKCIVQSDTQSLRGRRPLPPDPQLLPSPLHVGRCSLRNLLGHSGAHKQGRHSPQRPPHTEPEPEPPTRCRFLTEAGAGARGCGRGL